MRPDAFADLPSLPPTYHVKDLVSPDLDDDLRDRADSPAPQRA